jgi:hypothetical protein
VAVVQFIGPGHDRRLLLGGVPDAVASLERSLPAAARDVVAADRLHLSVVAGPAEIVGAVASSAESAERARVEAVLADTHAAVGRGHAALGLGAAMRTVNDRRAETVVLGDGFAHAGFVCSACGALSGHELACERCGGLMCAASDVVPHVVAAALSQGAHVEIVSPADIPWPDAVATIARF